MKVGFAVWVWRAEMICEQELPTVHDMLKNGIVGVALSTSGEGVVVEVVVLSRNKLPAGLAKPKGLDVTMNGLSRWSTFSGLRGGSGGIVVVVEVVEEDVELSRSKLLPIPNNLDEVRMIDLKGRPRASRRYVFGPSCKANGRFGSMPTCMSSW